MKDFQRIAIRSAGLAGLVLAVGAGVAAGQINMGRAAAQGANAIPQPPNPNAPKLLIWTFRETGTPPANSKEKLGFELAEELRERISKIINPRDMWVIQRQVVNTYLSSSGYQPDSALQINDIKDLGKQLAAAETIDGVVSRTSTGIRFEPRFYFQNNIDFLEIFKPVEGKDAGAVAREFADVYKEMRKQLADTKKCQTALYASKWDSSVVYGRAIIAANPGSNIGRLCMLSGFSYAKASPDSIIRVALEIFQRDSTNRIALDNLVNAYFAKDDKEKSVEFGMRILALDPTNTAIANSIISTLAQAGAPQKALPIINQLLANNPSDVENLRTKMNLQLRMLAYKDAFQTAAELVKVDTAAVTVDFYQRMILAAQKDSQPALVLQFLGQATQKFPKNAELQFAYSVELRKAGQLQQAVDAARRAVEADPKIPQGYLQVVSLFATLNQTDSAFAFAKRALAAGADSSAIGQAVLATLTPAYQKAQAANTRPEWQALLDAARKVDSIVPSPGANFFIGMAAGSIGVLALQESNEAYTLKPTPNKEKACAEATIADDMFTLMTQSFTVKGGGKFQPAAAGQIMQGVVQYNTIPGQIKTNLKCK